MTPAARPLSARLLLWVALAGTLACTAGYAAFLAAGQPQSLVDLMGNWVYNGTVALAGLTCLARAALVGQRLAWAAFGIGLLFWAAADVYWVVAFTDLKKIPYPSLADVGFLAALPCFYIGIVRLTRHRIGHFTAASWLDGAIGGLAAAAVGTAVLAPALVGLTKGDPAAVMTNLAYPLGDVLLIGFIVGALVVSGIRGAGPFVAIAAGLLAWTAGDVIYLYQEATSGYEEGWLDQLWLLGAALIALAAALSFGHAPSRKRVYRSSILLPSVFGAIAVAVLAHDHFTPLHEASVWLSVATLAAVLLRMAISFRENSMLVSALHADAVTDSLTGLGNRRRLLDDLGEVLDARRGAGEQHGFALFDLDGFKAYNDSFGHPAGDSLLRRLGSSLAAAVAPQGRAYRLGGDEFCVLARARGRRLGTIVEAARAALTAQGEGFSVGASAGAVLLPAEATTPSEALGLADGRMYDEKSGRSTRIERQTHDLLVRILREREPGLTGHHEDVARLAVAVGRELGLDAEQIDVLRRAAEFHDIGKIAIPDEILRKPDPLDGIEWELMRKHTLVGERILGASPAMAPVAGLVRASHERWDGSGYPDGLAGEEIPLGARIIFICDAYDAMRSERPYSPARARDEALAEIRRCAGTQFDSGLVEAFERAIERDAAERSRPSAAPAGVPARSASSSRPRRTA